MVVKKDVKITIYDTGKLLLKTKDEEKARKEIEEIERYTEWKKEFLKS